MRFLTLSWRRVPSARATRNGAGSSVPAHLHERLRRIGWWKSATLVKRALSPSFLDLLLLGEKVTAYKLKAKHGNSRQRFLCRITNLTLAGFLAQRLRHPA
jgi:hypothetical protein